MGWTIKQGLTAGGITTATAIIFYIILTGVILTEDSYYCANEPENILDCEWGISGGKGTRCYLNENKTSWDYCSGGWVRVLDYIEEDVGKHKTILSPYEVFKGWRILSSTGNESILFDSYIRNNQVCVSPKQLTPIVKQECKVWNESVNIFSIEDGCLEYHNVTYSLNQYKNTLPIYDLNKNILLQDYKQTFSSKDEVCYDLDSSQTLLYKLGLESIIIDGETSYASIDENITQETGFSHLALNDSSVVLYMPFDSNVSQSIVFDYTTNDNDGTITGAIFNSSGQYGGAYKFNGTTDFITISSSIGDEFDFGADDFTLEIWAKRESSTSNDMLITKDLTGAGNALRSFAFFIHTNDFVRIFTRTTTADVFFDTDATITDTDWHHLVVLRRGSAYEIYIDGVNQSGTLTGTLGTLNSVNTDIIIGARMIAGDYFDGLLDEAKVYNRSLSADEIWNNFNTNSSKFFPTGTMLFNNTNVSDGSGTENRLNITLAEYQNLLDTNISVSVNGTFFNLDSNGAVTNLSFTADPETLNITFKFTANTSTYYTPLMIGNITLDAFTEGGIPAVKNIPFSVRHWLSGAVLFSVDLFGVWTMINGETIDNLVDGWLRITGNLNVTGLINYNKITSNAWIVHSSEEDVLNFTLTGASISGNLTTINKTDGDILTITEGAGVSWQFNFTCSGFDGNKPSSIKINGWEYIGNHDVKLRCFNGTADEDITSDSDDFPQLGFASDSNFPIMNNRSRFINATGSINCNINHDGNGAANHFWIADSIKCESANIELDTPGEFVTVTNYDNQITQNINFNLTTGVWNIIYPGLYDFSYSHSFSGTPSGTYEMGAFVNGVVQLNSESTRTLNPHGDIGDMGNDGATILNLSIGDNVSLKIDCGVDECVVSSDEILVKLERD